MVHIRENPVGRGTALRVIGQSGPVSGVLERREGSLDKDWLRWTLSSSTSGTSRRFSLNILDILTAPAPSPLPFSLNSK